MKPIHVTVRQDTETGENYVFFISTRPSTKTFEIQGFSRGDGHFRADLDWMHRKTRSTEEQGILKTWLLQSENPQVKVVKRLTPPRGYTYVGT